MRLIMTGFLVTLLILTSGCASFFAPWFPSKEKETQEELKSEHAWLGKEQSESAKKESTALHTQLAGAYYSRGQYKIAIEEANKALSTNPSYAPAYNVLGLVYMNLHEDKLAKENFERALEIEPKDSETHNNFGWFLCQAENLSHNSRQRKRLDSECDSGVGSQPGDDAVRRHRFLLFHSSFSSTKTASK